MQTTETSMQKKLADFRPFRAWRYDGAKVQFEKVIAPPYDIISPEEQAQLYDRSPYNCVRLILNKIEETDTPENNRYTRAHAHFQDWQKKGILTQENTPCFFLYRQTFKHPLTAAPLERIALLGRLKLEDFEKGIVIPHEKTLSKPREDRKKLLEATQVNFSPVFGLYEDPKAEVAGLHHEIMKSQAGFEATGTDGVKHTVWTIRDPKQLEKIQAGLAGRRIYIADGHHRYQTALEYGRRKREELKIPAEREMPFDFVLMALVEFHDPGLVILPTHRFVLPYPGFSEANAVEALKPYFKIEPMSWNRLKDQHAKSKGLNPAHDLPSFGLALENDKAFWLTLENFEAAKKKMPAGKADIACRLDVNVLGHLIFAALWNLPETSWEASLRFTRYSEEALSAVQTGKAKAAFLLQPPQVEVLRDMGQAHELMPQKSTYFYPKLESGLVFYSHRE